MSLQRSRSRCACGDCSLTSASGSRHPQTSGSFWHRPAVLVLGWLQEWLGPGQGGQWSGTGRTTFPRRPPCPSSSPHASLLLPPHPWAWPPAPHTSLSLCSGRCTFTVVLAGPPSQERQVPLHFPYKEQTRGALLTLQSKRVPQGPPTPQRAGDPRPCETPKTRPDMHHSVLWC